jgi:NADH dehydrogenase FAD-containing subunit
MAVRASLEQGRIVAENIIAGIRSQPSIPYREKDPGFVVPMANGRSCGEVYGVRLKGFVATLLHYILSAFYSRGISNRAGIATGVLRAGIGLSVGKT